MSPDSSVNISPWPECLGTCRPNDSRSNIHNLTDLPGPYTEDAIIRTLRERFMSNNFLVPLFAPFLTFLSHHPLTLQTSAGPVLIRLNPARTQAVGVPDPKLSALVEKCTSSLASHGLSHMVIITGEEGAGKTFIAKEVIKKLISMRCTQMNLARRIEASLSVIRSLGSAGTMMNRSSTRMVLLVEFQLHQGSVSRLRLNCSFLEQNRVCSRPRGERTFDIFYQMLAGLSEWEKHSFQLSNTSVDDLKYLSDDKSIMCDTVVKEDAEKFKDWRRNCELIGINFSDVMKVFAAVLLIGNIDHEREEVGGNEIESVSKLLCMKEEVLVKGLTTRTHKTRGEMCTRQVDKRQFQSAKNSLVASLYVRTVHSVVKRINSIKPVKHKNYQINHGSFLILDSFGPQTSNCGLEKLCMNLCTNTMQHLYYTHNISSIRTAQQEDMLPEESAQYVQLIAARNTGLLALVDQETLNGGSTESLIIRISAEHNTNHLLELFEDEHRKSFIIEHHSRPVIYCSTDFINVNRDTVADDLIMMFHQENCSSGFVSHLFSQELKHLYSEENVPRGVHYRISPTSYLELPTTEFPSKTLSNSLQTALASLVRTVNISVPHLIQCIRPNRSGNTNWDSNCVREQVRRLHMTEMLAVLSGELLVRMTREEWERKYGMLGGCEEVVERIKSDCDEIIIGKKDIFLSEKVTNLLSMMRKDKMEKSAITIQQSWRQYRLYKLVRICLAGLQSCPPPLPSKREYRVLGGCKIWNEGIDRVWFV